MISMLYLELMLFRRQKISVIIILLCPIFPVVVALLVHETILSFQMIPLVMGWYSIGHIDYMKRYRQVEALFALSVAPKDIFIGSLLLLGIYFICVFLICLPLYLAGIGSMIELRVLFLVACLLMGLKAAGNYATMFLRRLNLISWVNWVIFGLFIVSWRLIQAIAEHPYIWIVLPISLIAIAISYLMTTRLSKERIILSSE